MFSSRKKIIRKIEYPPTAQYARVGSEEGTKDLNYTRGLFLPAGIFTLCVKMFDPVGMSSAGGFAIQVTASRNNLGIAYGFYTSFHRFERNKINDEKKINTRP